MEQQNKQPIQQLNQISTDEQKRKMSKRIKIALLVLAAIVFVIGVIVLGEVIKPYSPLIPPIAPQTPPPSPKTQTFDTSTWQTYRNEEFGFEVRYPPYWQLEKGYSGGKYSGADGFFEFLATEDFAGGIDEVSKYEAYFDERYGSNPIIESLKIDGQEAKLILPSDDQSNDMKNRAALVIRDPTPVVIEETKYDYLVVWADAEHIKQILSTFRFVDM